MLNGLNSMRCPTCKSDFDPATTTTLPFCSERCRTIDLGRWLGEEHSLPNFPDPEDDEKPENPTIDNHSSSPNGNAL